MATKESYMLELDENRIETYFHFRKENLLPNDLAAYEAEVELIKSTPFVAKYLTDLEVTDINFEGEQLFIEHNVHGLQRADIQPTYEEVNSFLQRARNIKNKLFDQSNTELDIVIGYLRLNAVHEKNNTTGHSFSIRVARPYRVVDNLEDIFVNIKDEELKRDLANLLTIFVEIGIPIIISGETGSAKTETQKLLISSVTAKSANEPPRKQIIVVEDTPDSHIKKLNPYDCIRSWVVDDVFTAEVAVRNGMRNNPDIFMIAEIRSREAGAAHDAAKTNHGIIATVHSLGAFDSPSRIMPLIRLTPQYANMTDLSLGREVARFFPLYLHMVKVREEVDGVTRTLRYPSELVELTGYSTENGFAGHHLFKSEYEYNSTSDSDSDDYFLQLFTSFLSDTMIQRIKNKRLYHKIPKRFLKQS